MLKKAVCAILIVAFAIALLSGCTIVNAQKMDNVKGTYKLVRYTYTPSYERREGYTPNTIDYIVDRGYEVYLVVTGTSTGYYVFKSNDIPAYSKEISLSYEYSTEEPSKVSNVIFRDSTTSSEERFGVTRDSLNYSKPGFDYTTLIGKKPMRSEDVYKSWERVDDATDLSYAISVLGNMPKYGYEEYNIRGVYELYSYDYEEMTENPAENPYDYYFVSLDTADGIMKATVYYKYKAEDTPVVKTVDIKANDGWQNILVGENNWVKDLSLSSSTAYCQTVNATDAESAIRLTFFNISRDISETNIEKLISERVASEEEF